MTVSSSESEVKVLNQNYELSDCSDCKPNALPTEL